MPRIQRVLTSSLFNSKSNFNYFHIKYFSISLFSLLDVLVIKLCFTDLFRFHVFHRAMAIFLSRCQKKKKRNEGLLPTWTDFLDRLQSNRVKKPCLWLQILHLMKKNFETEQRKVFVITGWHLHFTLAFPSFFHLYYCVKNSLHAKFGDNSWALQNYLQRDRDHKIL